MNKQRLHFQALNLGHALDHFFILIFPTAVLALQNNWGSSYAELLKYGSFGVLAYGLGSIPSGWLGDRWSQRGMMNVYFYGMGLSAILTAFAQTPDQLAAGVVAIGLFASIYHPVGTALVFSTAEKAGRAIAINGVAGNLGPACAAGVTAFLSQTFGWQAAFLIPGIICVLTGIGYTLVSKDVQIIQKRTNNKTETTLDKSSMVKLFAGIAVIACFGGLVFQSSTTALPKIIKNSFEASLTMTGLLATAIFILAAGGQLVIGELLDRVPARTLLLGVTSAQVTFLLLTSITSGWMLVPVLVGLMLSTYSQIPVNDWLIGRYAADQWRSRIYAMKYMLSFSTGPVAYWLIAMIYDHTADFTLLYWILAAAMTSSVAAAWMMPVTKPTTDTKVCA